MDEKQSLINQERKEYDTIEIQKARSAQPQSLCFERVLFFLVTKNLIWDYPV
jgi:hypothetical protein